MAGTSMKDIKLRIKSVESTMQITKAMQLVATSKLRRAKERMENSQPYGEISRQAMAVALRCRDAQSPFLAQRPVKRRCYVVIAGERGLAGGYNNNVFKAVAAHGGDTPYCVLPLGRKAIEKYHRLGAELLTDEFPLVESISVGMCYKLVQPLLEGFLAGRFDEVFLTYTAFQNMMTQEARVERLLPIAPPEEDAPSAVAPIYEMEIGEMLDRVMPDFLTGRLYSALCDSFVSEVAARRSAMDSATQNADAMISQLRLHYNQARQGAITQEITEIVAGAEQ